MALVEKFVVVLYNDVVLPVKIKYKTALIKESEVRIQESELTPQLDLNLKEIERRVWTVGI